MVKVTLYIKGWAQDFVGLGTGYSFLHSEGS